MLRRVRAAALTLCCASAFCFAASFSGEQTVDNLISAAIADGRIPGAVILVGHQGQVIFRKAYGRRAVVPDSEPMTPGTVFDCASLTKVVATTSSVMKLFEQGKIRLDAKVTDYLPEFANGTSDITVRDLMTHYSGFQPDFDLDPPWKGYDAGIGRALREVPVAPRESKFIYSDTNFILMGEIVHRLSGLTLDAFARREIFEPLGMEDTTFNPPPSWLPRIAPTERQKDGTVLRGVVHDPRSRLMGGVAGHAGMFSTADDLGRFCQMMLDKGVNPAADATHPKRIFLASTVDLFTSPQSPLGMAALRGLGWDVNSPYSGNRGELFPVGSSYGHTGFTGVSLWLDPASQTYVILLTNAVHPEVKKAITSLRKSVATAVAAAVGYTVRPVKRTRTGLDVLEGEHFQPLLGKRVGLITNQTGVDAEGKRNIDVMLAAGVRIASLFSPEHGMQGVEDKENIGSSVDGATGIRVHSLFSGKNRRPSPEMLKDLDVVVFDIADIGARFYTYATTMAYAMETCAQSGKPFMVLDRPNPLTGFHVEGSTLDTSNESFVGYFPMPVRHGMTMGELARMFNGEKQIHAALTVIPLENWSRSEWFDETGLPWVNPSPNMRSLNAAILYPAVGMLEYSKNYSVGRGTESPFEVLGAKWIDGPSFAAYLNSREIPGIKFSATTFQPNSSFYAGTRIQGIRLSVTNRDQFDTSRFGLEVAAALQKLYGREFQLEINRRLIGSNETISKVAAGEDAVAIRREQEPSLDGFLALRHKYLLYR